MSGDFITTLICGGTVETRKAAAWEKAHKALDDNNPKFDILLIDAHQIMEQEDKKSVGIEHSRQLKGFLKEKPLQHKHKVGLILEAEYLTVDAQNALLKTLEEPPDNSFLILTTPKASSLLPTVISRCHVINLTAAPIAAVLFDNFPTTPTTWLDYLATHKDDLTEKAFAIKLLEEVEADLRQKILDSPKNRPHLTAFLHLLWARKKQIVTINVNPRLALEELLLKL